MKAFVNCKVSKYEVLGSLKMHQAADHFIRGQYWEDGKGCSMGCTIHDFAPGEEGNHSLYPELFGLPESFAYLQDGIFEGLPLEESKEWSVDVISAIPEGCDVSKKIDEFLYWILSGEDSPISKYRDKKEIKAVAELYRQKLKGEKIKPEEWEKAKDAAFSSYVADDVADADFVADDDASTAAAYAANAAEADIVYAASYAASYATYYAAASSVAYSIPVAFKKMADKFIEILEGN